MKIKAANQSHSVDIWCLITFKYFGKTPVNSVVGRGLVICVF